MKNKSVAAWLAFVGGPLGLHRFYLHGLGDMWAWALPIPAPAAQPFIADRVPYAAAMTDGRTAIELATKGPAAIETAALWQNIKTCLHANMQKSQKVKAHG